jgi:rhodanese/phosphatase family protein
MSPPISLRVLPLPDGIPGRVYLSRMPGRTGHFQLDRDVIVTAGIDTVMCLTPMDEVQVRSPEYASSIQQSDVPWRQVIAPMDSFSVPTDKHAWLREVRSATDHLRKGGTVLLHCAFGHGRTGTTAICLLLTFGMTLSDATINVIGAGSEPEDTRQWDLLHWAAGTMGLDY